MKSPFRTDEFIPRSEGKGGCGDSCALTLAFMGALVLLAGYGVSLLVG